ncbi:MAG: uL15 family ribosomal protein [Candidatus Thermoplasmatota archaeon]|nr:uL15 family ribosomal protein [Candidatus Thermoplasmatota archaeon]
MAKKKVQKKRGSREHGRGRKAGRGAGLRGGKGNAGSFGHKFIQFHKKYGDRYFGGHGFKRPQCVVQEDVTCNVGDLERLIPELEEQGFVSEEGDVTVVDLNEAGYDKLLGAGKVHRAVKVLVDSHTDNALSKLEAQGGAIEVTAEEEEEQDEDGGE